MTLSKSWRCISGHDNSEHPQNLAQGDLFYDIAVPKLIIPKGFEWNKSQSIDTDIEKYDVIVLTQSCDLINDASRNPQELVAVCPVFKISDLSINQSTAENIRKGRVPYLHLLTSIEKNDDPWNSLVADFRSIYSLPYDYLDTIAETKYRLKSPYLEHFSQAFARYFMRVGLPGNHIPKFPKKSPS